MIIVEKNYEHEMAEKNIQFSSLIQYAKTANTQS